MNALQVHYTSCRRGQSPSSGFQVRSCSPELSAAELLEIAQLGNYRLPSSSGNSADNHPVALRYRRLQSGRYALTHSCYSGRDYSGREGNFMAHTLVPEQGPLPLRPTDYLNWTGWKRLLSQAEDTDQSPPPLPPVDLGGITAAATGNRTFAEAAPDREAVLVNLLTALGLVRATSRRIVIRDMPDQGWRWIACLLELLPLGSALDVTVSTYQFDSIDAADINATVNGSNFAFSATQRDYEFFMFEPAAGLKPTFPDRDPDLLAQARRYATTIVGWYLRDPERLRKFIAFMDSFKPCPADGSLAAGLALFQASSQAEMGTIEFRQLLDFINEYTRPGSWDRSITLLHQALASRTEGEDFENILQLVRLCISTAKQADRDAMAAHAFKGWLALLDLAVEDPGKYAARVDQCWSEIAGHFDPAIGYRLLLGEDQMELLRNHYRRQDPQSLALISRYLIGAVRASFRGPVAQHPDVCDMALAALNAANPRPCLAAIFLTLNDIGETAVLLRYIDTHAGSDPKLQSALADSLHDLLRPYGEKAWPLRQLLYDHGLSALLLAEFGRIVASGNKQKQYANYCKEAAALAPKYFESVKSDLAGLYWDSLDEPQQAEQAWDWFSKRPLPALDRTVMHQVVDRVNDRLSVDPREAAQAELARRLAETAAAHGIELRPNRPALRKLLGEMDRGADKAALLSRASPLIADLAESEYAVATEIVLRQMLPLTNGADEHIELVSRLHSAPFELEFVEIYASELSKVIKSSRQASGVATIVLAWIALSNFKHPASGRILEQLAVQLAARRQNEIAEVFRNARSIIEKNEETGPYLKGMARLEAEVRKRQRSFGNALRNIGRSLIDRANLLKGRH
jgi:hypothetical protein